MQCLCPIILIFFDHLLTSHALCHSGIFVSHARTHGHVCLLVTLDSFAADSQSVSSVLIDIFIMHIQLTVLWRTAADTVAIAAAN